MTTLHRTLLVVDDEPLFSSAVRDDLQGEGLEVLIAATGAEALRLCRERSVDVVLLDQRLPDAQGPDLCATLLETNERAKIVFVTAYPSFENARAAIRAGAYDYLSKPCELEEIHLSVSRCLRTLELERAQSVKDYRDGREAEEAVLAGASGGLAEVARLVRLAAGSDRPVLITGETGTGETLVAKAIHYQGPRRSAAFIGVNCAAFPESLIEAELFGHEKGAFTGAAGSREGLFEMAEGGTLLLDEIGEMPPALQTRLLSVLEDKSVRRIGGRSFRRVDFRLVAATNADVDEAVKTRRLREDLYYRLNVIRIDVPPLRERRQDLPELVSHFMAQIAGPASHPATVSAEEISLLSRYAWPGNLRELKNVLERAYLIRGASGEMKPSSLLAAPAPARESLPGGLVEGEGSIVPLDVLERRHVAKAMAASNGNLTHAARALGVSVSTLRRKVSRA